MVSAPQVPPQVRRTASTGSAASANSKVPTEGVGWVPDSDDGGSVSPASTTQLRRSPLSGEATSAGGAEGGGEEAPSAPDGNYVFVPKFNPAEAKKLSHPVATLLATRGLIAGTSVTIKRLKEEFAAANAFELQIRGDKNYSDADKVFVAKYKTHLLKTLRAHLEIDPKKKTFQAEQETAQTVKFLGWLLLAPGGVVKTIFYSTADAFSMLVKCTFLPHTVMVVASFVAGLLKGAIFYMFEVSLLTGAMGLKERRTFHVLAQEDKEQIEAAERIRILLAEEDVIKEFSSDEGKELSRLYHSIHTSVVEKAAFYDKEKLKERWYHHVVKGVCLSVGISMEIASVYFAVTYAFQLVTMFTGFSAGFNIAIPIVVVVFSITAICYFLAMSGKSTLDFYKDRMRIPLDILNVSIPDFVYRRTTEQTIFRLWIGHRGGAVRQSVAALTAPAPRAFVRRQGFGHTLRAHHKRAA